MSECNDYWCEYYGKGIDNCELCAKKDNDKDKPDLRVILKRRAIEQIELSNNSYYKQERGQTR